MAILPAVVGRARNGIKPLRPGRDSGRFPELLPRVWALLGARENKGVPIETDLSVRVFYYSYASERIALQFTKDQEATMFGYGLLGNDERTQRAARQTSAKSRIMFRLYLWRWPHRSGSARVIRHE